MADFAGPLDRLIQEFKRLPGVGQKSAQRLAFFILRTPREDAERFARALLDVKDNLGICSVCNNIAEGEFCTYCRDTARDQTVICVVEEPHNILPIETTRTFEGLYHVLHGSLSPLRGIGPEKLKIKSLLDRIAHGAVAELSLATNPTVEGEATANYIAVLLREFGVGVTRLAQGLPAGGGLEHADELTLSRALSGRTRI